MSNLNAAGGGLQYRGTKAVQPPNCNFHPRDPNNYDRFGYSLLDVWLNTTTMNVFVLVSLQGNSTSAGPLATWQRLTTPASDSGVVTLSGNDGVPVLPDLVGNLNIIGTDPLFITGSPGTNTETITIATATTTQIGATTLATNTQTRTGTNFTNAVTPGSLASKLGTQTTNGIPYSQGSTSAFGWTAAGTDGQIPIAATGGAPVFANIISTDGSITVTNSANGIDIETSTSAGGTSIKTTVYDTPGSYTFTKDPLTKVVEIYGWGGGGSGSGVVPGYAPQSKGGAGGTGGSCMYYSISADYLDTTTTVVVGDGGPATTGYPGTNGLATSFGKFSTKFVVNGGVVVPGGLAGGSYMTTLGGTVGPFYRHSNSLPPENQPGDIDLITMYPRAGGDGENSFTAPDSRQFGGGVNDASGSTIVAGGAFVAGNNGLPGDDAPSGSNVFCGGAGGGGGALNKTGGDGGFPGGGGGGAGGAPTSTTLGGKGGDGLLIVIEYLSD